MLFEDKFLQHIRRSSLIRPGDKLIVAVSGGADSMALLTALAQLNPQLGLQLIVAHYDHRLRPSSNLDLAFVKAASQKMNLLFESGTNPHPLPKRRSIEEFARDLRYAFLLKIAARHDAQGVLTAHTMDDLAETVLMRILRGTGLAGLKAIVPRREEKGRPIIRPMLCFSRKEVESYLKSRKIKYLNDPSNLLMAFDRNRVRKILIPFIEKEFQPRIKDVLSRLADVAATDQSYIAEQAALYLKKNSLKSNQAISIPLKTFKGLHCSLRRTILRAMIASLFGDPINVDHAHIDAIDQELFLAGNIAQLGRMPLPLEGVFSIRHGRLTLIQKKH